MATQAYDVERSTGRRALFYAARWPAIFAGSVAGAALYLLITMLGLSIGLSFSSPQGVQSVGSAAYWWTAVWGFVSMLLAMFVGGWAAGRMSGLRRRVDGMLHGFATWGLITLFFVWVGTTAAAGILGGGAVYTLSGGGGGGGALLGAAWWLFVTFVLSLGLALLGGAMGSSAISRRTEGDHSNERHHIEA